MKVGFVWDGNYPWDVRVEKICLSLIEAGNDVHMVCRNGRYEPYEEVINGIHIHRLPVTKRSPLLNSIVNFPFFFNPVWYFKILNLLEKENIDIVIVRDITLSLTTIKAAKKWSIPVVLDMAEPYPEMIKAQHTYERLGFFKKVVRNVKMAEWVERKTLENISMVFAMIEESKARLAAMGFPKEKVIIVSNTPVISKLQRGAFTPPGSIAKLKSHTIFLYVGFVNLYRGVQIAIQGLPEILQKEDNVVLVVVGSGENIEELKRLAEKLNVEENVIFEGYQHHTLIGDYVASCDVGIIPHFSCGLWDNTIPNKLFDYMCCEKPVLSSDAKPVKRIIEQEQCGLAYSGNSPSEFAQQAIKLLDPAIRRQMGSNGLNAIKRRYNWNFDSAEMLRGINSIVSSKLS